MAKERYFVLMGESQVGPLSIQQVRNMRKAGTIKDDTLLWREGDPEWLPALDFAPVIDDEVTEITSQPDLPAPELDEPEPMPAAPEAELEEPEPIPQPAASPADMASARPSADPDAPRITPSGIWREIEADRERAELAGESSVDQIGSSDEPTTDDPLVPGACPSCGAEIRFCPVCGRPLHEHP